MKVIKEGNWTVPWKQEMVCKDPQCGALLEVEEADVIAPDYCEASTFNAKCPICGTVLPIPAKDLPRRVKDALNGKRKYSSSSYWD